MKRVFVDTRAWFAYANRADPWHEQVADAIDGFPGRLVSSNYVFDETVTLARVRIGFEVARRIGEALRREPRVDLVRVDPAAEDDAWQLFLSRPDLPYSFTDCTSFVLMRRLGVNEVVALDRDFAREGFVVLPTRQYYRPAPLLARPV